MTGDQGWRFGYRSAFAASSLPDLDDTWWALQLTGDFGRPWVTYVVSCPDEVSARRRRDWWQRWRPDVVVDVLTRGPDGWAHPPLDDDVLTGDVAVVGDEW